MVQNMKTVKVFLQDACLNHQYIRHRDTSHIMERPERIRAVKTGLAAAVSRLKELQNSSIDETDDLSAALDRMNLGTDGTRDIETPIQLVHSSATVNLLDNPAVKFIHGDVDGDVYLEKLLEWAKNSQENIAKDGSEIPEGLSQTDLYLCPGSTQAIAGAIGTVCDAVNTVVQNASSTGPTTAFCAIRPPGHHCGEDTPSGFCFVNNVAVAAAHAHLKHQINRVVVLDIDLHHGNGTQSIAWQINEESYRLTLEEEHSQIKSSGKQSLKFYYGSLHDILSFPCEDGKADLVQAASTSIHGNHGQYIENVHLETYETNEDFFTRLYEGPYRKILSKAREFIANTGGPGDDVLVFISCGFDACEHEYPSMSRHNRRVPVEFFHRFTRDACSFANEFATGRIVSVLEGGYSDRALASGTIAHLAGLVGTPVETSREWWSDASLDILEKVTKKRRGGRPSQTKSSVPSWAEHAVGFMASLEPLKSPTKYTAPTAMRLRNGRNNAGSKDVSPTNTPVLRPSEIQDIKSEGLATNQPRVGYTSARDKSVSGRADEVGDQPAKKLPRVVLKLGRPPGSE